MYFQGVHYRQAESLDPTIRMALEKAVEAILDAGVHPSELEGTKTGVFVGSSTTETEIHSMIDYKPIREQFVMTG